MASRPDARSARSVGGADSGQGAAVDAMRAWHTAIVAAVVRSAVFHLLRWMNATRQAGWRPMLGAFVVWFADFMG